jgi:hypothetical protein
VKSLSSVVLAGSLVLRKYFGSAGKIIEPSSQVQRPFEGPGFLATKLLESSHAESGPNPIIDPRIDFRDFR